MSGIENLSNLPKKDGISAYHDRIARIPIIFLIFVITLSITFSTLAGWVTFLIIAITTNIGVLWALFTVFISFFVVFLFACGIFFYLFFIGFTKLNIEFYEDEVMISKTFMLCPCFTLKRFIETERINNFIIKKALFSNQFQVFLESLGETHFLVSSPNTFQHQKKLVELLKKQDGLVNLGVVERSKNTVGIIPRKLTKKEKKREKILRENAEKRARKIIEMNERRRENEQKEKFEDITILPEIE